MDWKTFATVFGTVFLAEIGDKTQLATLLFASRSPANLWVVFVASAAALVLASAIGVTAGALVSELVNNTKYLTLAAGVGFILVGVWTLYGAFAS
jgi:putative Ca2+/H+ antiporter (TMEM165/GDT1 family)